MTCRRIGLYELFCFHRRCNSIEVKQLVENAEKEHCTALHRSCPGGRRFTAVRGAGDARKEIVVSPAYKSHPEFEYFHPLWDFLRKAGIAFALISFAVVSGGLLLSAGHTSIADVTLMTARMSEIASEAGWATATTTAATADTITARCEKNTWAYLDGKCIASRVRKPRSWHAATDKSFGRSGLPVPAASPPKSSAITAVSAPATVKSTESLEKARKTAISQTRGDGAGNVPKKARKTTINQKGNPSEREERGRDARWSARAYAIPDGRNTPGMYERSWGWSR